MTSGWHEMCSPSTQGARSTGLLLFAAVYPEWQVAKVPPQEKEKPLCWEPLSNGLSLAASQDG